MEAAVNLVYTRVLAPLRSRTFSTLDELNAAIDEYVDFLNDREMKTIRISRRRRFDQIEAQHLNALLGRPPGKECGRTGHTARLPLAARPLDSRSLDSGIDPGKRPVFMARLCTDVAAASTAVWSAGSRRDRAPACPWQRDCL